MASATAIAFTHAGVPSPGSIPMPAAGSGSWRISRAAGEGTPPWVRAMAAALAVLILALVAAGVYAAIF